MIVHESEQLKVVENECITTPESEGLVFIESARFVGGDSFIHPDNDLDIPKELMRPLVIEDTNELSGDDEGRVEVKSTLAMGRAAYIEHPTTIGDIDYNFVQWKGVGANAVNKLGLEKIDSKGGTTTFPLGESGVMPMFVVDVDGKTLIRFMGASYCENLLLEEQQSCNIEQYGLRMPRIITTMKFSRQFCIDNNLPVPTSDEPNDFSGQSPVEYIESNKDRINDTELYDKLINAYEAKAYESAVIGQNIRAFRNIWRVIVLEEILEIEDEQKKQEQLAVVLDMSSEIFSREFGEEVDYKRFVEIFSGLMGDQVAILLNNKINQGAMNNHKQDITLAAEVCDFDGAHRLTDEYLDDPANHEPWVKDEATKQEWISQKKLELYRQILLVGSHLKPVLEAMEQIGTDTAMEAVVDEFVNVIVNNLNNDTRKDLLIVLKESSNFQSIVDISGTDLQAQQNLDGYQPFFDVIVQKTMEKLKSKQ